MFAMEAKPKSSKPTSHYTLNEIKQRLQSCYRCIRV